MAAKKRKTDAEKQDDQVPMLYSYWRSSCSWRVRIALEWKKIAYKYVPVHLLKDGGQHLSAEYTKLNPMQQVPALVIDGHCLTQSTAIIEYLEDTRPENPLLPRDPYLRATSRKLAEIVGSGIQPVQNLSVLKKYKADVGGDDDKKTAWAKHWVERGLQALETEVKSSAGKYCVGDQVTVADLYVVPQLYNARRFDVDVAQFPTLIRVEKNLEELPPFKAAHPSVQPDAEK